MPRLSLLWLWGERAEVRLTTLERPAFLPRLPLHLLSPLGSPPVPTPPRSFFPSLSRLLTQDVWFLSVLWTYRLYEHRGFPSSRYSFSSTFLLLSNHRFISTHSLFVHSESFALIVEVKWDSKKRSQGCASTPRASLSMNCCKTILRPRSQRERRKKFQVLRRCVGRKNWEARRRQQQQVASRPAWKGSDRRN